MGKRSREVNPFAVLRGVAGRMLRLLISCRWDNINTKRASHIQLREQLRAMLLCLDDKSLES